MKLGLGIAIAAPWVAGEELEDGSLAAIPLLRGKITRHWIVARIKDRATTLAERTFAGLCQEIGAELASRFRDS